MIRSRSLKNTVVFASVCLVLLLLNNYFVGYSAKSVEKLAICPALNDSVPSYIKSVKEQVCTADGGIVMRCLKDDDEFYFPFSFIKKRFDVTGKLSKDSSTFEWFTSYSKFRTPELDSYDSGGPFGHFATYNVENRDRVRCINAETGVPMSTQWDTTPYYYPIQIAQYGLQHYSRLKTGNVSDDVIFVGTETKEWKGSPGDSDTSERVFFDDELKGDVVNISSPDSLASPGCYLYLDEDPQLHVISFEWLPRENASFTILVKLLSTNRLVLLNYIFQSDDRCVWNDHGSMGDEQVSFSYSLGPLTSEWQTVTRDALVDASRALSILNQNQSGKKKDGNVVLHPGEVKLVTLGYRGVSTIRTKIAQKGQAHHEFFLRAADWLVGAQNEKGGWSVPVERSIAERRLVLPAGWHSAMAQGHGLSLLTRAFIATKDSRYVDSAIAALDLFNTPASSGGVVNEFLGRRWFEEYPTTPGSFVLNGFMYSLVGLYDLSTLGGETQMNATIKEEAERAKRLFNEGIDSLMTLLPLFDTGSGSIYDLRHFSLKTAPNLARWDYHAVHVYLLKWLFQITGNKQLDETAERWIGYSYGKRAKHN